MIRGNYRLFSRGEGSKGEDEGNDNEGEYG